MKSIFGNRIIQGSLIIYLMFTTGCYYDAVVGPEAPETVSYSVDVQPYFDAKCLGCHNGSGAPLNLDATVSYENLMTGGNPPYVDITNPSASFLYVKIAPGSSMEPYSSAKETAMVLKWIEDGAENN